VVVGGAVVDADRGFLALAADRHDPAAAASPAKLLPATQPRARLVAAAAEPARPAAALSRRPPLWTRLVRANRQRQELAVLCHRILVFLAEVASLHEHVDARRILAAILRLEQVDRARVLLAAKDQLGFLLSLHLLTPYRQQGRHEDRHD